MSTRYNNGSHYENHQRAAELHDIAAHAHRVAEQRAKHDHLHGNEHSSQAFERSQSAHKQTQAAHSVHGIAVFSHHEIAALAHKLWEARGCPEGSPQEDWLQATAELQSHSPKQP